jgi:hypothetical protein
MKFLSNMETPFCQFGLLPSGYFLCALTNIPNFYNGDTFLEISERDKELFTTLQLNQQNIISAIKAIVGRKATVEDEVENDNE